MAVTGKIAHEPPVSTYIIVGSGMWPLIYMLTNPLYYCKTIIQRISIVMPIIYLFFFECFRRSFKILKAVFDQLWTWRVWRGISNTSSPHMERVFFLIGGIVTINVNENIRNIWLNENIRNKWFINSFLNKNIAINIPTKMTSTILIIVTFLL